MIRVCYYKGCGVVYGEKKPLSDKSIIHGQQGKPVSKYSISCEKIQEKTSLTFLAIFNKMMS